MKSVEKFANSGGLVLGICNGFQILCEAGLLPGAMMRNSGLRFICRHVHIRVEQTDTPFTNAAAHGQVLKIPIAHSDGNYTGDETTLADLEKNRQVIFRYTMPDGAGRPAAAQKEADDAGSAGLQRWVGDFPIHGGSACRRRESDGMITPPKAVFFVGAQHAAPLQLPSRENGNGYYRN